MLTAGIILSIISCLATLLPISKYPVWYIRDLDFPRVQVLFLGMLGLAMILVFYQPGLLIYSVLALVVICIGIQVYFILPYTFLWPKEVKNAGAEDPDNSFSIVICNVYMKNKDSTRCLEVVTEPDPDMLFFVETDDWWEEYLRPLEDDYQYTYKYPMDNTYGLLLYSRLELAWVELKFLVKGVIPSLHGRLKLASGRQVHFRLIHPEPPAPGEAKTSKNRDAELVIIGKEVRDMEEPVFVGGDLNDVAWSHTTRLFQRISRLLDPRVGRGMFNTFHAKYWFLRWPLDHVFFSGHFSLIELRKLDYTGSDHFPIFAKLHLDGKGENKPPRQADKEDHEEANEKEKERE